MDGVFRGLAELLRGIFRGRSPREIPRSSPVSPRKPNRYTSLEYLSWSHSVFWQFIFCRKRRFMKPLLLSSVDTFFFIYLTYEVFYLYNTFCPQFSMYSFVSPPTKTLLYIKVHSAMKKWLPTHFPEKARHLLTLRKIVTCKAHD